MAVGPRLGKLHIHLGKLHVHLGELHVHLGRLHIHLGELDVLLGHVKMGEEDLLLEDGKPFFVLEVISVQLVVGLQVMVTTFVLNQFVEKTAFVLKHSSEEIAWLIGGLQQFLLLLGCLVLLLLELGTLCRRTTWIGGFFQRNFLLLLFVQTNEENLVWRIQSQRN